MRKLKKKLLFSRQFETIIKILMITLINVLKMYRIQLQVLIFFRIFQLFYSMECQFDCSKCEIQGAFQNHPLES